MTTNLCFSIIRKDGTWEKAKAANIIVHIIQSQLKLLSGTMEYTHNPTTVQLHSTKTTQ